jgi:hypothetical protein
MYDTSRIIGSGSGNTASLQGCLFNIMGIKRQGVGSKAINNIIKRIIMANQF